jgi:3-oxosteroid 1-dehydrogenase
MTSWDDVADLVIVGSGGGGLVAALTAADAGLEAIVLEKQALVGGSTAMSGGMMWMPNNPLVARSGITDSLAHGLAYLEDLVGDVGAASSPERRTAFLTAGPAMLSFLEARGVQLIPCPGTSDYYTNLAGGKETGRSIEAAPFDVRALGVWRELLPPGMTRHLGLVVKTNELRDLAYYNRSPRSFAIAARVWLRTMFARVRRQELVTNGASLIGQTLQQVLASGVPVWTNTAFDGFVVEDGRVVGVHVVRDGTPVTIEARHGVLLAAGGFSRNADMRRSHSGSQPNEAAWTVANPGDTGEALEAAMHLGAETDLLDEAWWMPTPSPALAGSTLMMARQRPGAIFVDAKGRRFCNEANSPVEVGKAMYADDAVPCWLIFDDGYRKRYAVAKSLPGKLPSKWIDKGLVTRAPTLEELGGRIGVDPEGLVETVRRFNADAERGIDPDHGRGASAHNRYQGDPAHRPNPALGPLDTAPFYATTIYPADAGTCGGLITDEHARVLDQDGAPIPGLYATGNITATVMGRTYPGQGASIAYTMTFGFVAARHAAGCNPVADLVTG